MECPICFEINDSLVAGPCGHGVCWKCADLLFFGNAGSGGDAGGRRSEHGGGSSSAHQMGVEFIPTLGKCPLCRKLIRSGDLKFTSVIVVENNKNDVNNQQNEEETTAASIAAFPSDAIDVRLLDIVYAGLMGVGWASIHLFEPTEDEEDEQEEEDEVVEEEEVLSRTTTASVTQQQQQQQQHESRIRLLRTVSSSSSYIMTENSRLILTDPIFHRATQTLSFRIIGGTIQNAVDDVSVTQNDGLTVLTFSDNYFYIARGMIILPVPIYTTKFDGVWNRRSSSSSSSSSSSNNNNNNRQHNTRLIMFNRKCIVIRDGDDDDGNNDDTTVVDYQTAANHNNNNNNSNDGVGSSGDYLGRFQYDEIRNVLSLHVRRVAILQYPQFVVGNISSSAFTTNTDTNDDDDDDARGATVTANNLLQLSNIMVEDEIWTAVFYDNELSDHPSSAQDNNTRRQQQQQLRLPPGTRIGWKRPGTEIVHEEWVLDSATSTSRYGLPNHHDRPNNNESSSDSSSTVPVVPISGRDGQLYWRLDAPGPTLPGYNPHALVGNVFCQNGRIGLASYHFVAVDGDEDNTAVTVSTAVENDVVDRPAAVTAAAIGSSNAVVGGDNNTITAYISYEHSFAATKWPPLDNGRPIPAKMYFTNISLSRDDDDDEKNGTMVFRWDD